jgi:HAD superfamily hydrolase (TIGR01509 family)
MQQLKAVIFDLDGTLVSTKAEYRYHVVGSTLRQLGRKAVQAHIDIFWFEGNRDEIIRTLFQVDPLLFWKAYTSFDLSDIRCENTIVFEDTVVLQQLRQKGLRLGIVTNAPHHIAHSELELIGAHLFDAMIVADPVRGIRPKPAPDGIITCLNNLDTTAQDALFIGNSHEDIEAARAAGVRDIYIDRDEYKLQIDLTIPSTSIRNLEELLRIIC